MERNDGRPLNRLLFTALLLATLHAQSLPVVPMQMDPDQLAHSLRERKPLMPMADCKALDLWECHPDQPGRVSDISLRWVQMDDDPELEAVLVTEAKAEHTYAAYIFEKQGTWNLVGSFFARQWTRDGQDLIRIQKLTEDSPPLLLVNRDLGGSGSTILTTEAFHLRQGKLWPVLRITDKEEDSFPFPNAQRQQVLASGRHLVIHTIQEKPPGREVKNECEVWKWNAAQYTFVSVPNERVAYCDPRSGKPISGKSSWAGLPIYP